MNRLPLLFNPKSGPSPKDPDALLARLPAELRAKLEILPFGPPWDFTEAIEKAARAEGPLLVWGGDGTIHHAGKALMEAGCPVPLGAIPGGSGNGLVRGLRTPLEPEGAVMRLLEGRELCMDLGRLDGEPFLNLCGTGFEATVAHAFDALPGRGFSNYARTVWRLWRKEAPLRLRWDAQKPEADEPHGAAEKLRQAWEGPEYELPETAWSLCFANLPQYGAGFWIAPKADPTDGALQWAVLDKPGPVTLFTQGPGLFREGGRSGLRREGRILRAIVRLDGPKPWHMDGEPVPARESAELSVERGAFRMQVTGDCPWF